MVVRPPKGVEIEGVPDGKIVNVCPSVTIVVGAVKEGRVAVCPFDKVVVRLPTGMLEVGGKLKLCPPVEFCPLDETGVRVKLWPIVDSVVGVVTEGNVIVSPFESVVVRPSCVVVAGGANVKDCPLVTNVVRDVMKGRVMVWPLDKVVVSPPGVPDAVLGLGDKVKLKLALVSVVGKLRLGNEIVLLPTTIVAELKVTVWPFDSVKVVAPPAVFVAVSVKRLPVSNVENEPLEKVKGMDVVGTVFVTEPLAVPVVKPVMRLLMDPVPLPLVNPETDPPADSVPTAVIVLNAVLTVEPGTVAELVTEGELVPMTETV